MSEVAERMRVSRDLASYEDARCELDVIMLVGTGSDATDEEASHFPAKARACKVLHALVARMRRGDERCQRTMERL